MAYDEGHAEEMRGMLADLDGIAERRMFGGLCFQWRGNMLCGVHKFGGMARVGKDRQAEALAIAGVREMSFTGRPMGGMVEFDGDFIGSGEDWDRLMALAREFVGALPPK